MAEQVDAQDSKSCGGNSMEVQFFSLALKNNWGVLPFDSAAGALAVQAFPGTVRLLSF